MNLCFYIVLGLFLVGIRPCFRRVNENYISKDAIQPVKGLFILLVFLSHFSGYINRDMAVDGVYVMVRRWLGQMIVVPFLFYSGFGVSESIRKKGQAYLRMFPVRRIFNVAFQFAVAVAIYILYRSWFMEASFPLRAKRSRGAATRRRRASRRTRRASLSAVRSALYPSGC